MHQQLGEMQRLRRRLGIERGGKVLAARDQPKDARRRGGNRAGIEHRARVLDHGNERHLGAADAALQLLQQLRERAQPGRLPRLRHQEAEGSGARGRLGVEPPERVLGIDAHEYLCAALGDASHRRCEPRARSGLLCRRDRIFEVENDGVGAALVRPGEEALGACRHIEERSHQHGANSPPRPIEALHLRATIS